MIAVIRSISLGQGRIDGRRPRVVRPGSSASDARDDEAANRLPVPVQTAPSSPPPGYGRPQISAAFITQLAALHLGAARDGERRIHRNDPAVAPRAAGSYGAARALPTAIEPGFLVRREV